MKTLRLEIELEYDDEMMHGIDVDAIEWFYKDVLGDTGLSLHSKELGDMIGTVRVIPKVMTFGIAADLFEKHYAPPITTTTTGEEGKGDT